MHFSAPILIAILSVCPSIAAQYMYGSEDVDLDFLEARDEYLTARDNFLQARGIYGYDEGKLLVRDFNDDEPVLVRRIDCSVCGARTSHNSAGGVCQSCRRIEAEKEQEDERRKEEEKRRQEAAQALIELSKSGGRGTNSAPPRGGKSGAAGGATGRSGGARTAKTGARRSRQI